MAVLVALLGSTITLPPGEVSFHRPNASGWYVQVSCWLPAGGCSHHPYAVTISGRQPSAQARGARIYAEVLGGHLNSGGQRGSSRNRQYP